MKGIKATVMLVVLSLLMAMSEMFVPRPAVPLDELPRWRRRLLIRRGVAHAQAGYPRWMMRVDGWLWHKRAAVRRRAKYGTMSTVARMLAAYCWMTRPEGFEGYRMSYWRWFAALHLNFGTSAAFREGVVNVYSHTDDGRLIPVPMGGAKTHVGQVSPLYYKKVAGGLPVLMDMSVFPGNIFFVDSGDGSDTAGNGTHPDSPFDSIDFTIAQCTATQGDVIFVLPGHAEAVSAAAGLDLDIAGISVIGVGHGGARPTITIDTADTADIDVDAANIVLRNVRVVIDVASLNALLDVNAAGFLLEDCDFYGNDAVDEAPDITLITDAAANDMVVRGCSFNYLAELDGTAITATPTECIRLVGADRARIEGNYISGDFTTSAINGITTPSLDIRIVHNQIHNIATEDIALIIDLVAGCNGLIGWNWGFSGLHNDASALALIIDPASCGMVENYFSNVVTETGAIVGTASG